MALGSGMSSVSQSRFSTAPITPVQKVKLDKAKELESKIKLKTYDEAKESELSDTVRTQKEQGKTGTAAQIRKLKHDIQKQPLMTLTDIDGILGDDLETFQRLETGVLATKSLLDEAEKILPSEKKEKSGNWFTRGFSKYIGSPIASGAKWLGKQFLFYSGYQDGYNAKTLGDKMIDKSKLFVRHGNQASQDMIALAQLKNDIKGDVSSIERADTLDKVKVILQKYNIDHSDLKAHLPDQQLKSEIDSALKVMGQHRDSLLKTARALKKNGEKLRSDGMRQLSTATTGIMQMVSPLANSINFISQSVHAANQAKNWVNTLGSNAGKAIGSTATAVIGVAAGALQIVTESVDMYQNNKKLQTAKMRVKKAKMLLAGPQERRQEINRLQAKLDKLDSNPGFVAKLRNFMPGMRNISTQKEMLRERIDEIKKLPGSDKVPDIAKKAAKHMIKRADMKYKRIRILKNVVGIAAGAVAIAVAAGALATPVGWVAAGVAIAGTVGCFAYSSMKYSSRNNKEAEVQKVQEQLKLREQHAVAQKEKAEVKKQALIQQLSSLQSQMRMDVFLDRSNPDDPTVKKETALIDALKVVNADIEKIDTYLTEELPALKAEFRAQTMGISSQETARQIYYGARGLDPDGNPMNPVDKNQVDSMRFLAKSMGIVDVEAMREKDAIKVLMNTMNIDVAQ